MARITKTIIEKVLAKNRIRPGKFEKFEDFLAEVEALPEYDALDYRGTVNEYEALLISIHNEARKTKKQPRKTFKLWIHIEEYDHDTDDWTDLTDFNKVEPVPIGLFPNLKAAVSAAESVATDQKGKPRNLIGAAKALLNVTKSAVKSKNPDYEGMADIISYAEHGSIREQIEIALIESGGKALNRKVLRSFKAFKSFVETYFYYEGLDYNESAEDYEHDLKIIYKQLKGNK